MQEAIVGTHPEDALFDGRFSHVQGGAAIPGIEVVVGDAAGVVHFFGVSRSQIRADHLPGLAAVGGLVDVLAAHPNRIGAVTREHHREIPVPAVFHVLGIPAVLGFGPGAYVARDARAQVGHVQATVVTTRPHEVGIKRIDLRKTRLATAHKAPVADGNTPAAAVAGAVVGVAILAIAEYVVGDHAVHRHVVKLGDGQVDVFPGFAAVQGHVHAAIVRHHLAIGIFGVKPHVVAIAAHGPGAAFTSDPGLATVFGFGDVHTDGVHLVGIACGDPHPGVVGRTLRHRMVFFDQSPRVAAIVGAVEARLFVFDQGVHHIGVAGGNTHGGFAHGVFFAKLDAAGIHGLPSLARIGRAVNAAGGAARVEVPGFDVDLPHGGEKDIGVVGVNFDLIAARVFVQEKDAIPGFAPVGSLVHTALLLGRVGIAQGGDVDGVGIGGVHHNAPNASGFFQAQVPPAFAGIGRLVHAIAQRVRRPNDEGLTRATPHLIGVAGGNGQGTNGGYVLVIKNGPPVEAAVFGFEDATRGCADVGDHGVAGLAGDGGGAVAVDAEEAEGEVGEGLGGEGGGQDKEEKGEVVAHGFLVFLEGENREFWGF